MLTHLLAFSIAAVLLAFTVTESSLLWVVGLIVSILTPATLFAASLAAQASRRNRAAIESLALDVKQLQTQISPFWQSLQTKLADALHHPSLGNASLDRLLEKLEGARLTVPEKRTLVRKLEMIRIGDDRDAAAKATALLNIMPLVIEEVRGELPETDQRSMAAKKLVEEKEK